MSDFSKTLILCLLCVPSSFALAESSVTLDTVLVIAERPGADDIDVQSQATHVSVIRAEDFAGDVTTIAEVLASQSSIQVRQSAGLGSYSTISIRGSSSSQVNVFLDGMLLNDSYGSAVDLSQIQLAAVESIEIFRGNTPTQLGPASIGGSINIKTKQAGADDSSMLKLGYGSYKTKNAALTHSGSSDSLGYLASVEYLGSDNDYEILNDNQTENNPFDDKNERRRNSDFEQSSALVSLNQTISPRFKGGLIARYLDSLKSIPNVTNSSDNNASLDVQEWKLQSRLDHLIGDHTSAVYQVSTSERKTTYDDRGNNVGLSANYEKSSLKSHAFKTDLSHSVDSHLFNLGAQVRYEQYENDDFIQATSTDASRTMASLSLQDEWYTPSGSFQITSRMGGRFQRDNLKSPGSSHNNQSYVDAFTGVLYTPNSRVSLNAAASYDVRPPSLYELFGDEGASVGNDELREETAINAELGAAFETKSSRVFVSGFYRALDDAIVLIYDARGIGQAENITKARIYGITFDASSQLNSWLGLHADITVQSSEDLSEVRAFQGNSLPGVYENKLRLGSTARLNGYEMSLEYRLQSDGYYDRTAAAEMPTSQQFDIDVKKNWASHTLALSLINLNDERVEDFNRFPGPGRRAFITYNYIF